MSGHRSKQWAALALILAVVGLGSCQNRTSEQETQMSISPGMQVSLEYTLKLSDDTVVDSNVGGDALVYTQGAGQLVPGLEREIEGMKVGETKLVTVEPADGYGNINDEAIRELPKDQIPADALREGAVLRGQGPAGEVVRARVSEVKDQTVVVDFNHPLAGKTLHFTVKVLDIQPERPR